MIALKSKGSKKIMTKNIKAYFSGSKFVNIVICGVVLISFFLILLLNYKTPLVADDFSYSFITGTRDRVSNIMDIVISQVTHYFTWGGRSVVHFLAQFFLLYGNPLFMIINSLAYVLLVGIMCINCGIKEKVTFIPLFLFVNIMIWFFVPSYGQNILWLTGSCNYLWGFLFIAYLLMFYRRHLETVTGDGVLKSIGIFIFSIVAGWTNENTSVAMIAAIILFIICYRYYKMKVPKWAITGLIGAIIGCTIMLVAPGNFVRGKNFEDNRPFLQIFLSRFKEITLSGIKYLLPLVIIFAVLLCINIYFKLYKNKNFFASIIYLVATMASMYAMILAPYFPERAWFGVICYFILSLGNLYINLDYKDRLVRMLTIALLLISLPIFILSYKGAYGDISNSYSISLKRGNYIEEQKLQGNFDVIVEKINKSTKYNPILTDLTEEKDHWINEIAAEYYGLNTIVAK